MGIRMWQLLKSEISYNRSVLFTTYLFMTLIFLVSSGIEMNGAQVSRSLPHLLVVGIFYIMFTNRYLEKRTRFHQLLPISIVRHGRIRLLYQMLFLIGALVLYSMSHVIYSPDTIDSRVIWRLFSLNSMLILGNAAYTISFDWWVNGSSQSKLLKLISTLTLWLLIFSIGLFYIEVNLMSHNAIIHMLYFNPIGIVSIHLFDIVLSYLSVRIFMRRRTYFS